MTPEELRARVAVFHAPDGATLTAHVVPVRDSDRNIIYNRAQVHAEQTVEGVTYATDCTPDNPIETIPADLVGSLCYSAIDALYYLVEHR